MKQILFAFAQSPVLLGFATIFVVASLYVFIVSVFNGLSYFNDNEELEENK